MPAERAGYTVTMFVVDISESMGATRIVPLPPGPDSEERFAEMTHLQYALQYVKFKIQDMIYNARKTDRCGVITFGTEETNNQINSQHGGYENVTEYIPIATPSAATLRKLDELNTSDVFGDPIDALIVAVEAQDKHLGNKKTWTRKVILVTDGEGPIELEDWEATAKKLNELNVALTVVGVDFDDEEFDYVQENKPDFKRVNEEFLRNQLCSKVNDSVIGNLDRALEQISLPDVKTSRSTLMHNVLRIGDVDTRTEEAMEILVKTCKCTAINRPKAFKKFAIRPKTAQEEAEQQSMNIDSDEKKAVTVTYAQLKARTEYYVDKMDRKEDEEEQIKVEDGAEPRPEDLEKVEKEELIRGFKYGTSYVPCPEGQFPKLSTKKGIDLIGFIPEKKFRRDYSMGEVQYIWGNPDNPTAQCAISSIVQAMYEKGVLAVGRWVTGDGRDPRMGAMSPALFDKVHCLLWVPMPFADDIRKYTFPSLNELRNKKGEIVTEHAYLPNEKQLQVMDDFVDSMDLMEAGDKNEEGKRTEWLDIRDSYNPSFHRLKQAMFHCAVVSDLETYPLPPPHPELMKYFNPPKKLVKKAQSSIDNCIKTFNIKHVPKAVKATRKDGHNHANDDDDEMLLLDRKPSTIKPSQSQVKIAQQAAGDDSETEDEDDEMLIDEVEPAKWPNPLPTPARSLSTSSRLKEPDDDDGMDIDPQRDPDRLIGRTNPLADFKANLEQGDVVTKVVEDMSAVIQEVILAPFASRRSKEMIECLTELREVCLQEDEITAWNSFLPELKKKCTDSSPGNKEFWSEVQNVGRALSLISDKDAKKNGGLSQFSEAQATDFLK
ncbi:SPOC domain-like protein [Lentinula aciculospora]|uniref:ATP-dependent DNA helicase II subunit 2 n=1 Tax=Lentinula aciculospora TaxID=153920 RepID=A0A9W9DTA3_9AGAR|nr:SPOC domain-like protein [Lentinula aciculospora]